MWAVLESSSLCLDILHNPCLDYIVLLAYFYLNLNRVFCFEKTSLLHIYTLMYIGDAAWRFSHDTSPAGCKNCKVVNSCSLPQLFLSLLVVLYFRKALPTVYKKQTNIRIKYFLFNNVRAKKPDWCMLWNTASSSVHTSCVASANSIFLTLWQCSQLR